MRDNPTMTLRNDLVLYDGATFYKYSYTTVFLKIAKKILKGKEVQS